MPNFVSYATYTAELAMQKNRVLNHSITHLPSLFDAPAGELKRLRFTILQLYTVQTLAIRLPSWTLRVFSQCLIFITLISLTFIFCCRVLNKTGYSPVFERTLNIQIS